MLEYAENNDLSTSIGY